MPKTGMILDYGIDNIVIVTIYEMIHPLIFFEQSNIDLAKVNTKPNNTID